MDTPSAIPDDVLQFIDRHITSVDQLEILLLLRAQRRRTWSPAQVSSELRNNPEAAAQRLTPLVDIGLLARDEQGCFRYEPTLSDADRLVSGVDDAYRQFRLRVIERIFAKPDGLAAFADAFRLRKDR